MGIRDSPMVVYSVTVNSSVSSLFLAGFIPGILIGLVLIAYSYFYARKAGYKGDTEPFSIGRALREVWRGKWALLSPVIILGGIYGGIFTPTEAAAVSVIYSLIIGLFVHKELNFKQMLDVTKDVYKRQGLLGRKPFSVLPCTYGKNAGAEGWRRQKMRPAVRVGSGSHHHNAFVPKGFHCFLQRSMNPSVIGAYG